MRRTIIAAIATLLIAGAAHAQDDPTLYEEFENWGVYRYADYCRAMARYETSTLAISYDAGEDLAVIHLRSQALARFEDEKEYPFEFVLLQNGKSDSSIGNINFTVINRRDFVGAIGSTKAGLLFEALSKSTALALAYEGQKVEAVELGKIGPVIESLKRCDLRR
jgi:hypothetical protein